MSSTILVTNKETGKVASIIIRTSAVWYYVSPEYVKESIQMKFCPPQFRDAYEKIKRIEGK